MSVLFPKTITYEYHTADATEGDFDDTGDWVAGDPGYSTFQGSVQAASGKDVNSLPVGREDTGKVKIYSNTKLPSSKKGGDEAGAIVYWQGQMWEVISDGVFQNNLIPHYKCFAQYVGEGEPPA